MNRQRTDNNETGNGITDLGLQDRSSGNVDEEDSWELTGDDDDDIVHITQQKEEEADVNTIHRIMDKKRAGKGNDDQLSTSSSSNNDNGAEFGHEADGNQSPSPSDHEKEGSDDDSLSYDDSSSSSCNDEETGYDSSSSYQYGEDDDDDDDDDDDETTPFFLSNGSSLSFHDSWQNSLRGLHYLRGATSPTTNATTSFSSSQLPRPTTPPLLSLSHVRSRRSNNHAVNNNHMSISLVADALSSTPSQKRGKISVYEGGASPASSSSRGLGYRSDDSKRRKQQHQRNQKRWLLFRCLCSRRSEAFLISPVGIAIILSLVTWVVLSLVLMDTIVIGSGSTISNEPPLSKGSGVRPHRNTKLTKEERDALRQEAIQRRQRGRQIEQSRAQGLFSQAASGLWSLLTGNHGNNGRYKKNRNTEDLQPGCQIAPWTTYTFPNCNALHETDLRAELFQHQGGGLYDEYFGGEDIDERRGYVGSGLWRHVFLLNDFVPLETIANPSLSTLHSTQYHGTVLKMMKGEHDVDARNVDRHRRDALVMERLTAHPSVVDIYAYCGTSVLTEYVGQGLDSIVFRRDDSLYKTPDEEESRNPHEHHFRGRGQRRRSPLRNVDEAEEETIDISITDADQQTIVENATSGELERWTRKTPKGRLQLAHGVAKAMMALHEFHSANDDVLGPILHADLQSKQFLLSSPYVHDGIIKINDFNRCRLFPNRITNGTSADALNATGIPNNQTQPQPSQLCPVRIPTAPGAFRSPEEYKEEVLTKAADMYAIGHVLFQILTGRDPWQDVSTTAAKHYMKEGQIPIIPKRYLETDVEMVALIHKAYELDPSKRLTAVELEKTLKDLLNQLG